ncbi:MAG: glycosyltransferase family 2 protein [Bacilli bacterium]
MKISIITISYNSEKTIEETIKSVINQKNEELEYIIVDGGSRDSTCRIIEKYIESIDVFISEKDFGISDAFNKGIKLATGDFIGIVNSDDILYPNAIKKIKNICESTQNVDVIFGNIIQFENRLSDGYIKKPNLNLSKLTYTFLLFHPAMFISKDAYKKYGMYSHNYKFAMDYELISKMFLNNAKFKYIDEVISAFREGGVSQRKMKLTLLEHKIIAKTNGTSETKINLYIFRVYINQMIIKIVKKLKIEKKIRGIINRKIPIN